MKVNFSGLWSGNNCSGIRSVCSGSEQENHWYETNFAIAIVPSFPKHGTKRFLRVLFAYLILKNFTKILPQCLNWLMWKYFVHLSKIYSLTPHKSHRQISRSRAAVPRNAALEWGGPLVGENFQFLLGSVQEPHKNFHSRAAVSFKGRSSV